MTRRKPGSLHLGSARLAADITGSHDAPTPLDVLLGMMGDSNISSGDRIEIAKICLPFIHPRIALLHPSKIEPPEEPADISDPNHILEIVRLLAFCFSEARHNGREIPSHIWPLVKHIPRGPDDFKALKSGQAPSAPHK
jgi:hypothetical protein